MKRLLLLFTWLFCGITLGVNAQNLLRGKVLDSDGQTPLIGAVVGIEGESGSHAVTNENGEFSLKVAKVPVKLKANYIGYNPGIVTIKELRKDLTIVLHENATQLNEVVVTALGISRAKKSLGYSAQEVSNESLTQAKESNIVNSLEGKIAGVRITNSQGDMGSSRIIIRGETSIAGENQPLFIIDGIAIDNSQLNAGGNSRDFKNAIADLNPEDIESMNILKGPNAAALYGSRAAHGVVVIKTKSGKGKKGLGIDVHSSTQFATILELPKYQNVFGQGADGQFSYVDGKGGGVNDGVDESWGPRLDGRLIPQFDSPIVNSVRQATPWIAHPNNVRDFFELGYTLNNGISITNSDDKFDFRLGYNNEKQNSIVPGSESRKNNITFNANYKVTSRLSVGATANYIDTYAPSLPGGPFGQRAAGVMLQFTWFGRQVDMNSLKQDYSRNWNNSYYSNPYWRAYYNTTSQQRNRIIGDVHFSYELLKELTFSFRSGTDYYNDRRKYKIKYGTNGTPYGSYAEDAYTLNENNTEYLLHYNKNLNDDFSLDALVGYNIRNKSLENNYQKAPRLAVADLYTLANSRDALTSSNTLSRLRNYGLYASAQLGYKNFAYLNVTGRNDWSSTLPAGKNSYFYPSANLSLLVTEWLPTLKSSTLSYLKLRGGWSQVGNDADPYQLYSTYTSESAFNGNPQLTSSQSGKNSNLKPEITSSTELGFEAGLFNNRLHLDFAYYNTVSKNQILNLETTAASGYTSQLLNAGKITNKGVEIQLGVTPIKKKDFSWDTNINYASNRNKVVKLDDAGRIKSYTIYSSTVQVLASVGQAYGTLFGTAFLRDGAGNIIVDAKGLPKADPTQRALGKFTPDWTGGISNTLNYKNISLSFLIDASFGGSIYSGSNMWGQYAGVLASTLPGRAAEFGGLSYYYPGNDNSKNAIAGKVGPSGEAISDNGIIFKGVTANGTPNNQIITADQYYKSFYSINEAYVYSSEFVKLRELSLTYRLPKGFASKIKLVDASVSLVGRNLWTIHKKVPNIDPEASFGTGNGQGVESLSLPTVRTFGINISAKF
ncbi:SusC/RagA family TonB-linked outer membrane protein [uncultured Bacteroides sp.]|uniref:SusC/RagA family TonB-linked outer membrane protein n=1 Tax=uncultured Bacteroides sp. TaxID=162156 RepID=UPI002AAA6D63|nr:SusC/RagA family TonB-linked outer membrane protein [uncultured Bacteroides sp.]